MYGDGEFFQSIAFMPQLRRLSEYSSLAISCESDVRILLDALSIIFELSDSSVYVDGYIITALNDAGLREYWRRGIYELLRDDIALESDMFGSRIPNTSIQIPDITLISGQVWDPSWNPFFQITPFTFGGEIEFLINSMLVSDARGVLEAGSVPVPWTWGAFNVFRFIEPRANQWRQDHFVVINRIHGYHLMALRNGSSNPSTIRVQGMIWVNRVSG